MELRIAGPRGAMGEGRRHEPLRVDLEHAPPPRPGEGGVAPPGTSAPLAPRCRGPRGPRPPSPAPRTLRPTTRSSAARTTEANPVTTVRFESCRYGNPSGTPEHRVPALIEESGELALLHRARQAQRRPRPSRPTPPAPGRGRRSSPPPRARGRSTASSPSVIGTNPFRALPPPCRTPGAEVSARCRSGRRLYRISVHL